MELTAQLIGIVAMAANILSYQCKKKKSLLLCQLLGGALFACNMFLLGAKMGGLLNSIAVARAIAYLWAGDKKSRISRLNWTFYFLYFAAYLLDFTLMGTEPSTRNLILEVLPLIGMVALNIGFSSKKTKTIRICGLVSSPCWLVYNCFNFAIGGIICEIVSIGSILWAYARLDRKK
jgi:hypothetical protein